MINHDPVLYDPNIQWPKISIVTPSFNQGKYIEETICSVLSQNYPNLEYIIIDGGSKDETVDIIQKYGSQISYWVSEPDRGQSHAINKGIEKCTGEIFNWLNSDDWYMPGTLFEVATAFMKNKFLQFVSGYENHVAINGDLTLYKGTFLMNSLEETIELCEVTQPSTFFKLDAIRKVNGVPEDIHYIMDGELWVKLLLLYGQECFLKIPKLLVNFRLHENSKTVSNQQVDNFLYERCSIITDLQRFAGVPVRIIQYYIDKVYQSPKVYSLNREWKINERVISKRKLRLYFTRKYITKQFLNGSRTEAAYGIKQLFKSGAVDGSFLKSLVKLFVKNNQA